MEEKEMCVFVALLLSSSNYTTSSLLSLLLHVLVENIRRWSENWTAKIALGGKVLLSPVSLLTFSLRVS